MFPKNSPIPQVVSTGRQTTFISFALLIHNLHSDILVLSNQNQANTHAHKQFWTSWSIERLNISLWYNFQLIVTFS